MVLDDAHGNVKVVVVVDDVAGTVLAVAVGGGGAVVTTAVVVYTALDSLSSFWWSMTFFCSFQSVKKICRSCLLLACCLWLLVPSWIRLTWPSILVLLYNSVSLVVCDLCYVQFTPLVK